MRQREDTGEIVTQRSGEGSAGLRSHGRKDWVRTSHCCVRRSGTERKSVNAHAILFPVKSISTPSSFTDRRQKEGENARPPSKTSESRLPIRTAHPRSSSRQSSAQTAAVHPHPRRESEGRCVSEGVPSRAVREERVSKRGENRESGTNVDFGNSEVADSGSRSGRENGMKPGLIDGS